MMALSVILMCSGQTSWQHLVMLHMPTPALPSRSPVRRCSTRTWPPCSSTGRRGRARNAPGCSGSRRAPPSLPASEPRSAPPPHPRGRLGTPGAQPIRSPARPSRMRPPSGRLLGGQRLGLAEQAAELVGHFRDGSGLQAHPAAVAIGDVVDPAQLGVLLEIVEPPVRAPALLAVEGCPDDGLGYGQHEAEVPGGVPARVVAPRPRDMDHFDTPLQLEDLLETGSESPLVAGQARPLLHRRLQLLLQAVRIFLPLALEGFEQKLLLLRDLTLMEIASRDVTLVGCGGGAGAPAEDKQVGERIPAEAA